MWLALIAVVAGCAAGLAGGGRFRHLATCPFAWLPLVFAGAACEGTADRWVGGGAGMWLAMSGYGLMSAFALRNLRRAGSVLVAVGLLSNLLVVGLDSGMPVRGIPPGVQAGARHHGEGPGDRLAALGDMVRLPPLGETVSAGDILIATGAGTMMAFALMTEAAGQGSGRSGSRDGRPKSLRNGRTAGVPG